MKEIEINNISRLGLLGGRRWRATIGRKKLGSRKSHNGHPVGLFAPTNNLLCATVSRVLGHGSRGTIGFLLGFVVRPRRGRGGGSGRTGAGRLRLLAYGRVGKKDKRE